MCLCECALFCEFCCECNQTGGKRKTLSRSSNRSTDCGGKSKLTLAHRKLSNRSVGELWGKNESKKCVLEKKREINFAYITFFVVNATFALRIPRFCFRTKTSEIDLPRISLVCFVLFSFVSVILFILICLHSSYNIYKTSQKYKQIFC